MTEAMLADARGNARGLMPRTWVVPWQGPLPMKPGRCEGRNPSWLLWWIPFPPTSSRIWPAIPACGRFPRISLSHALSIHALVQRGLSAGRAGRSRDLVSSSPIWAVESPFVLYADGRILDANNANSGGPFSPTRAGGLPTQELLALCFSGRLHPSGAEGDDGEAGWAHELSGYRRRQGGGGADRRRG